VRRVTKILVGLLIGVAFAACKPPFELEISSALSRFWWVLPFTFALASLAVMTVASLMGQLWGRGIPARFLSRVYLMVCPSLAILGILATFPTAQAPPPWVGFAVPVLLFTSAWVHYHSLGYDEAQGQATEPENVFEIGK